jgi:hypothetical protein
MRGGHAAAFVAKTEKVHKPLGGVPAHWVQCQDSRDANTSELPFYAIPDQQGITCGGTGTGLPQVIFHRLRHGTLIKPRSLSVTLARKTKGKLVYVVLPLCFQTRNLTIWQTNINVGVCPSLLQTLRGVGSTTRVWMAGQLAHPVTAAPRGCCLHGGPA